jgi:hypothetical protein
LNDLYIYNLSQANFFISNGLMPRCIGINSNSNKTYVQFTRNEEAEQVFTKWVEECNAYKLSPNQYPISKK